MRADGSSAVGPTAPRGINNAACRRGNRGDRTKYRYQRFEQREAEDSSYSRFRAVAPQRDERGEREGRKERERWLRRRGYSTGNLDASNRNNDMWRSPKKLSCNYLRKYYPINWLRTNFEAQFCFLFLFFSFFFSSSSLNHSQKNALR